MRGMEYFFATDDHAKKLSRLDCCVFAILTRHGESRRSGSDLTGLVLGEPTAQQILLPVVKFIPVSRHEQNSVVAGGAAYIRLNADSRLLATCPHFVYLAQIQAQSEARWERPKNRDQALRAGV